jgi:arabinan endo-1,5-alpha-L-arabinosidase
MIRIRWEDAMNKLTSMSNFLLAIALGLTFTTAVHAAEGVLDGTPDPTVVPAPDGKPGYYVFATGGGTAVWFSPDLLGWKKIGRVFDRAVPDWARQAIPRTSGIWAPDISFHDGLYYLYYSVSTFGSQRSAIGLAVSRSVDPSDSAWKWEDRGLIVESSPRTDDFNAIDPALFVDQDGSWYLFWGSYWTGIKMTRIDPVTGKPFKADNPIISIASRAPGVNPPAIEAPYVVFRNGYYYLFVSYDFCCAGAKSTYKVMVGRAKNAQGPYVDFHGRPMTAGGGTLVLGNHGKWRGPGHNSVLPTDRGDLMVHHTYDAEHVRAGRILQIRPIYWPNHGGPRDGWPVVGRPISEDAGFDVADTSRPTTPCSQDLIGSWRHWTDFGQPVDLEFLDGGTVLGGRDNGRWAMDGTTLILSWKDADAHGGFWRDRLTVEPHATCYTGRNQHGTVVYGLKK